VSSTILVRSIPWILWLQQFSPGLDWPMGAITQLGEATGILLLISLLYWGLDRPLAVRMTLLFVLSLAVNTLAKELLGQPRPFELDPRVLRLDSASGGGLPSGHTQAAVVTWGLLALTHRRRWVMALCGALLLLVPLSRLYLGMHFPTDLLGGYLLGALLLWGWWRWEPAATRWLGERPRLTQLALTVLLPAALLLALGRADRRALLGACLLVGAGLGYHLLWPPARQNSAGTLLQRLLRWLVGLGSTVPLALLALSLPIGPLPVALLLMLVGVWTTVGAPWLFVRLGLASGRPLARRRAVRPRGGGRHDRHSGF
jgi:glycerophosphoryl diester phosphodiesterase